MATTAQWIFDKAMALGDELSDTGIADSSYTQDLKARALPILNVMRHECFRASDQYPKHATVHATCDEITHWDQELDGIDDVIAQGVMPYGLAAQLLLDEAPDAAAYCAQKYGELLARLLVPAASEPIFDPYGSDTQFNYMGRW
nr:MAG TPA: hypothetical protein [Caudoviricetes sp.]